MNNSFFLSIFIFCLNNYKYMCIFLFFFCVVLTVFDSIFIRIWVYYVYYIINIYIHNSIYLLRYIKNVCFLYYLYYICLGLQIPKINKVKPASSFNIFSISSTENYQMFNIRKWKHCLCCSVVILSVYIK